MENVSSPHFGYFVLLFKSEIIFFGRISHSKFFYSFFSSLKNFSVGAPLINYGSSQSTSYGETSRFKPYVDPAAYEDPNQVSLEILDEIFLLCKEKHNLFRPFVVKIIILWAFS